MFDNYVTYDYKIIEQGNDITVKMPKLPEYKGKMTKKEFEDFEEDMDTYVFYMERRQSLRDVMWSKRQINKYIDMDGKERFALTRMRQGNMFNVENGLLKFEVLSMSTKMIDAERFVVATNKKHKVSFILVGNPDDVNLDNDDFSFVQVYHLRDRPVAVTLRNAGFHYKTTRMIRKCEVTGVIREFITRGELMMDPDYEDTESSGDDTDTDFNIIWGIRDTVRQEPLDY